LQDNDEAGRKHARKVGQNLQQIVEEIRIVSLPGLPDAGDVSDWLELGGTREKLLELSAVAPLFRTSITLDPKNPIHSAREFKIVAFTDANGLAILHRHRGAFWLWTGSHFRLCDEEAIRAGIWTFLEEAKQTSAKGLILPFKPTRSTVGDVADALEAICQLNQNIEPPTWLNIDGTGLPAKELLSCANGLLHLPTGELLPHSPSYFNLSATDVPFDPNAPEPLQWLAFIHQLFENDPASIEVLQDIFGYLLSPETSQQKILLIVGPKRSGKGTIGRVLTGLLGEHSVAGPTMSSLGTTFGLEPLITRPLAIVSDARIGGRDNKSTIVERLLSISGEDQMTVDRKFRSAWHGRLITRFIILTNELPALNDGSGALAGRFIVLVMTKSFFGQEDPALSDNLKTELPGILKWAVVGYRRLHERGHFIQPKTSQDAVDDIEMLAAPVKAFVRDRCEIRPGMTVTVDELWFAWQDWCVTERRDAGTKAWFGRNLRSAEPGIMVSKLRSGDQRTSAYVGIALVPIIGEPL